MSNAISTITAKWQVTIPEGVRKELPLKIGERISWQAEGDKLIGRRVPSVSDLAGCLKENSTAARTDKPRKAFAAASVARHNRISKQRR